MTDPRAPLLSVVVCTRAAGDALRWTLDALSAQTLVPDSFEVVVVLDGAPPGAEREAQAFEGRLRVRWSRQREAGIASARNHGLFLARGGILLFLDEDAAEPDLLERHVEAHRRFPEPRFAVLGRTALDPSVAGDPLMRFLDEAGGLGLPPGDAGTEVDEVLDWTGFRTGRSSVKRALLLERGTFGAAFRDGGEDAELAYRLSRHGFQVVREPRAVARVRVAIGVDDLCRRAHRLGRAGALLARLHPVAEVRAWAGVAGAADAWRRVAPAYGSILRSARELDRLARLRLEAGIASDPSDVDLLHRSYRAALQASRTKGAAEEEAEGAGDRRRSGGS